MVKKIKNVDYIMLLSMLLIISAIVNIYTIFKLSNYKYKIGQQSYVKIADFKQRNEINMNILSNVIEKDSIKNQDLLRLYKNYDAMSGDAIELWQQYGAYKQNAISLFSKNIKTNKAVENDIQAKIKEYILSILNKEMKNEKNELKLEEEDLKSFEDMYKISSRMYEYFNKFNEETLKGIKEENKEKEVIKNHYWIDMLDGIYSISDDYVDLQWKIESPDENLT